VALRLGSAVHREVFGARGGLEITRVVALQAPHHGHAQFTSEEGVFAKRLLATPPPRVTEDVDVGRPEGETLILAAPAGGHRGMMLGARLVGDGAGDALDQHPVPSGPQPDDLRKDGRPAIAADTMAGFAPPVVGGYAEAFDRAAFVEQLADFFQQRKAGDEIVDAGGERKIRIVERKSRRHRWSNRRRAQDRRQRKTKRQGLRSRAQAGAGSGGGVRRVHI